MSVTYEINRTSKTCEIEITGKGAGIESFEPAL